MSARRRTGVAGDFNVYRVGAGQPERVWTGEAETKAGALGKARQALGDWRRPMMAVRASVDRIQGAPS